MDLNFPDSLAVPRLHAAIQPQIIHPLQVNRKKSPVGICENELTKFTD